MYVLIGCPGSGKGTFAQNFKEYDHLSTGDITRVELRNETEFGLKYKDAILNHVIGGIPFEEIQNLVEQRLEKSLKEQKGVILDGYPKTVGQCELLDEFIHKNDLKGRVIFIFFDVFEETAIDRILYRQTCEKCNKIYNSKFFPSINPDVCDECQGNLSKRMDDNIESTKKRVYEFKDKMKPVIEYYSNSSRLDMINGNSSPEVCSALFFDFHRSKMLIKA